MTGRAGCVFCAITDDPSMAAVVAESPSVLICTPLAPAAPGHVLVVPKVHVRDATEDPDVTAMTFRAAAIHLGQRQGQLLTSVGPLATQTVMHLHVHVVPRSKHDGLHEDWPWHRALYDGIRNRRG